VSAVLAPRRISARPILRPTLNNRCLHTSRLQWLIDNTDALESFWLSLPPSEPGDVDYFDWLLIQHDLEVIRNKS
jgi:hypothetical protein